jgi:hypothetical protein
VGSMDVSWTHSHAVIDVLWLLQGRSMLTRVDRQDITQTVLPPPSTHSIWSIDHVLQDIEQTDLPQISTNNNGQDIRLACHNYRETACGQDIKA